MSSLETGLEKRHCVPCHAGAGLMNVKQIEGYMRGLHGWQVVEGHHLTKTFLFQNFKSALDFATKIGALAEEQQHHPAIHVEWGKVGVTLYTHKIDGLHENDFILAAKIDHL